VAAGLYVSTQIGAPPSPAFEIAQYWPFTGPEDVRKKFDSEDQRLKFAMSFSPLTATIWLAKSSHPAPLHQTSGQSPAQRKTPPPATALPRRYNSFPAFSPDISSEGARPSIDVLIRGSLLGRTQRIIQSRLPPDNAMHICVRIRSRPSLIVKGLRANGSQKIAAIAGFTVMGGRRRPSDIGCAKMAIVVSLALAPA
jgi:hypothetical protein